MWLKFIKELYFLPGRWHLILKASSNQGHRKYCTSGFVSFSHSGSEEVRRTSEFHFLKILLKYCFPQQYSRIKISPSTHSSGISTMSHSSFFLSGICYYRLTEKKPWSKSFWTTMCPIRLQRPGISVVKTWVCVEILFLKVGKDLLYNNNNIIIVISNKKVLGKTMSPNPAWYIHNITLGAYHFSVMAGLISQSVNVLGVLSWTENCQWPN